VLARVLAKLEHADRETSVEGLLLICAAKVAGAVALGAVRWKLCEGPLNGLKRHFEFGGEGAGLVALAAAPPTVV